MSAGCVVEPSVQMSLTLIVLRSLAIVGSCINILASLGGCACSHTHSWTRARRTAVRSLRCRPPGIRWAHSLSQWALAALSGMWLALGGSSFYLQLGSVIPTLDRVSGTARLVAAVATLVAVPVWAAAAALVSIIP